MKTPFGFLRIVIIGIIVLGVSAQSADLSDADWDAFSKNLVVALKSENPGIQQSAMQLVIKYQGQLDVKDALFDVMHMFRYHESTRVRQLALVTILSMNSRWAVDFLKRQRQFEDDPIIKRHLDRINFANLQQPASTPMVLEANDVIKIQKQLLALGH